MIITGETNIMKLLKADNQIQNFFFFVFCPIEFTRRMSAHYNPKMERKLEKGRLMCELT